MLCSSPCWRSEFSTWNFQLLTSKCSKCMAPKSLQQKSDWLWQNDGSLATPVNPQQCSLPAYINEEEEVNRHMRWQTPLYILFYSNFIIGNVSKYSILAPSANTFVYKYILTSFHKGAAIVVWRPTTAPPWSWARSVYPKIKSRNLEWPFGLYFF